MPGHSGLAGSSLHGSKLESVSGTPQGSRNAAVIGETVVDSVTNIVYRATATGTGSWVIVGASPSGSAGGDLSGTYPNPTVHKIEGVDISGTAPTSGQVLTASSETAAAWAAPTGGSDASTTVKGITKLSVSPVSASDPIAVGDNDTRNTNSRAPSGSAGGDLGGTYPNPAVAKLGTTGTSVTINTAAPPTTGQVLTATGATAAAWSTPAGGGGGMTWTKYTKAYTDFSTAATTNSITLLTLAAKDVLHGVVIKHTTAFSGGAISAYAVSVGKSGSVSKYATAFSTFSAVADSNFQMSENFVAESFASGTTIQATATSTGANLNAATAGSVEIWTLTSTLAA